MNILRGLIPGLACLPMALGKLQKNCLIFLSPFKKSYMIDMGFYYYYSKLITLTVECVSHAHSSKRSHLIDINAFLSTNDYGKTKMGAIKSVRDMKEGLS